MAVLKKIYPLLLALILTGCSEDFTPDVDVTPVLCLNSLITAGEPVEVSVTHTWLYTDGSGDEDHKVDDAVVHIYVNGSPAPQGFIPREGDRIRIVAESVTYGVAEAEVTVPEAPDIDTFSWHAEVTDLWSEDVPGWEMLANVTFGLSAGLTVADRPGSEDYYRFSYLGFNPHVDNDDPYDYSTSFPSVEFRLGSFLEELEPIFSEHVGAMESLGGGSSYGFTFFTDRQFSGKSYTLHLQFKDLEYFVRNQEFDPALLDCGLTLTVSSVSRSYYNWADYCWQMDNGIMGDLGDVGLGDPIWGYSNVSTGAGVVAAESSSTVTVKLSDFLGEVITGGSAREGIRQPH